MAEIHQPTPEELQIQKLKDILDSQAQNHGFDAVMMLFEGKILVSVCTHGELTDAVKAEISHEIDAAIAPTEFSIHFVDQDPYS